MYICLKHGFKLVCKPVVGLDECHIKNQFKCQLLAVVGIDPNNCMYPIAYAVFQAEKFDSWSWFISLLITDFDMRVGQKWTFISDRQNGLIQVIINMLPTAEHRFCVRHMHNNFKQDYRGMSLKIKLWELVMATNMESFKSIMEIVILESIEAYEWLNKVPFEYWSMAHFMRESKCDILLNNMCESFN